MRNSAVSTIRAGRQLGPLLGSFCPNILSPFAREEVSSLAIKGGFPQLLLEPINFDALYAQHQQGQAPTANA
ncbi:MAG: protein-export chaperone SecB [Paracoccaceae bacterium]